MLASDSAYFDHMTASIACQLSLRTHASPRLSLRLHRLAINVLFLCPFHSLTHLTSNLATTNAWIASTTPTPASRTAN